MGRFYNNTGTIKVSAIHAPNCILCISGVFIFDERIARLQIQPTNTSILAKSIFQITFSGSRRQPANIHYRVAGGGRHLGKAKVRMSVSVVVLARPVFNFIKYH